VSEPTGGGVSLGAFNGYAIAEITKNALGCAWTLASYSPWQVWRPRSVRWVFLGTSPAGTSGVSLLASRSYRRHPTRVLAASAIADLMAFVRVEDLISTSLL